MWNQHHFLVLLQAENPHQLPSKKDALWKGVISQPKGVKTQPKGVIFSGVILRVFKTISFRQPASQMGVQLFGCWLLEYYVSLLLYFLIGIFSIFQRIAAGQRGSKKTSPIKWNAFFCLKCLFFWDANCFGCSRNAFFFLLPVDLGILYYYILCIRSALKVEVGCLNTFFFQPHLPPTSPDITADLAYHGHVNIVNHVKAWKPSKLQALLLMPHWKVVERWNFGISRCETLMHFPSNHVSGTDMSLLFIWLLINFLNST